MATASMLRGSAAGALRHHPVVGSSAAPFPLLRGGLHGVVGAGSSPRPPPAPAAAAMAMTASRYLSTTKPNAPAEERRKQQQALANVEAGKDELLRELVLVDGAAGMSKIARAKRARTVKELADFLRRQVQADAAAATGGAVATTAEERDRHLLLALLVRSVRAEEEMEKLRSRAARAERDIEEMSSEAEKFAETMEKLFDLFGRGMRVFGALARDVVILASLGYVLLKNM